MQAIQCTAYDPDPHALTLADIPAPRPGPTDLLIRVHACGVNYADTLMIAGRYQHRPELPFSPGMEMAGEVLTAGSQVTAFAPGDRVMAVQYTGGFAEQAVIPAAAAIHLPAGMDAPTAAAFPATYSTSHIALTVRGRLQPGETLLVLGAAGGIGLAAVEIGTALGATVIAGASTPRKLSLARSRGAAHTVNYRTDNLRGAIRTLTAGRGVDVVFDPVGGDLFKHALRSLAWQGRHLVVGFASGDIPTTSVNRLLIENTALIGVEWGTYMRRQPATVRQSIQTLLDMWRDGHIAPHVSATHPLHDVPRVLQQILDRKTTGRVVITP